MTQDVSSALIGPDLESLSSTTSQGQTNKSPTATSQNSDQDAVWERVEEVGSEDSDEPVVQSDEEDIQPDTSLVALQVVSRSSDESDSATDTPSS